MLRFLDHLSLLQGLELELIVKRLCENVWDLRLLGQMLELREDKLVPWGQLCVACVSFGLKWSDLQILSVRAEVLRRWWAWFVQFKEGFEDSLCC